MSIQERDFQAPRFVRDDWQPSNTAFFRFIFSILAAGTVVTGLLSWLVPALV
jgi:hypothetical protein